MESSPRTVVPNHQLKALLQQLGWRPESLATRVNTVLAELAETRRVHAKSPYRWLNRGEVPHAPVPDIVVWVLADAIGTTLTFEQVWPRGTSQALPILPANHGMDVPWDSNGLLRLLEDWRPMLTRRTFMTISGSVLTGTAWQALEQPGVPPAAVARGSDVVTEPLLHLIEDVVARAQQLDDRHGGAASVFVSDQFASVSGLLRCCTYDAGTGRRLVAALAQLAQTAGFMAYDSNRDAKAQRWYLIGLRAAHAADELGLAASILGLLSNQMIELGRIGEALQLGAAGQHAAARAPAVVQALIAARTGLAHAAAGDLTSFLRTRDDAVARLERATDSGEEWPRWASYVNRTELDAIAGRGYVVLAGRIPARRRRMLAEAETLLRGRAHTDLSELSQRSALRHGAWLGLAHTRAGDLDQAVAAGRQSLARLPGVTSARIVGILHQLRTELARHTSRSPSVKEFVADLDIRLSEPAVGIRG